MRGRRHICLCLAAILAAGAARADRAAAASRYANLKGEDAALRASVRRFLGPMRNDYSQYQGAVADQVQAHLARADRPFAIAVGDGFWLVSGSVPNDAQEKGAALLDSSGRVHAVGLLVFVGQQDERNLYEAWIYVADDALAGSYLARMKRWSALGPAVVIKATRFAPRRP